MVDTVHGDLWDIQHYAKKDVRFLKPLKYKYHYPMKGFFIYLLSELYGIKVVLLSSWNKKMPYFILL